MIISIPDEIEKFDSSLRALARRLSSFGFRGSMYSSKDLSQDRIIFTVLKVYKSKNYKTW
jgi:nitric oxide reductase activation protein